MTSGDPCRSRLKPCFFLLLVVQLLSHVLFFKVHGLQHTRLPCPSLSPRVYSNSCPLSRWCHLTISSLVTPFSSCLQSFPASRSLLFLLLDGYWEIGTGGSLVTPVFYVCDIAHNNLPHKAIWGTEQKSQNGTRNRSVVVFFPCSPLISTLHLLLFLILFSSIYFSACKLSALAFQLCFQKKELITIILLHDMVYQTLFLVISSYSVLLVSFAFIWFITIF